MTTPAPTAPSAELQAAIRYFQNLINTHRAVAGCCRCARCKVYEFTIATLSQSSEAQRAVEAWKFLAENDVRLMNYGNGWNAHLMSPQGWIDRKRVDPIEAVLAVKETSEKLAAAASQLPRPT